MSDHIVEVSPEQAAQNQAFLDAKKASGVEKRIVRHSLLARITHGVTIISCILLCISGLFVFVPPLGQLVGQQVVFTIRMSHRVIGAIFVCMPLFAAIASPHGVVHVFKNLFAKWTKDDIKWMIMFFPYLFGAKWIHMPDQDEVKSGQRFADGMLWLAGFLMAITGVILVMGTSGWNIGGLYGVMLTLHDIGFFMIAVFGMAHIFLGGGIFQPYKGSANLMFGDGTVSEADALYHWGHWARKELEDGKNVIEVPTKK